jgi:hypothetical protein
MPRVLTAARAQVQAGSESAYLEALGELARRLRARGESFWLFRHPAQPGCFLEFSESATPERHRLRRERDAEETALEERLRDVARYGADGSVLWEEGAL